MKNQLNFTAYHGLAASDDPAALAAELARDPAARPDKADALGASLHVLMHVDVGPMALGGYMGAELHSMQDPMAIFHHAGETSASHVWRPHPLGR